MQQFKVKESKEPSVSPLTYLYLQMKDKVIEGGEATILKSDITRLLYEDIIVRIACKQLINWQIRGEVTSGKSTVASHFAYYTNQTINSKANHDIMRNFNKYIFSDQMEFLRFVTGKNVPNSLKEQQQWNIAIQIDEDNRMKDTGYNATRETTLFNYYSDVFAQKFVHRFAACPAGIIDINTYCILDIIANDMKGVTKVKVIYRDITNLTPCILGYALIDVNEIMKMPWYIKYRTKKFKRMELLQKEGLSDIREPEYSHLSLMIFDKLKEITKIQRPDTDIIGATLEEIRRQEGRQYSIPTEDLIIRKVRTLLGLNFKWHQAKAKLHKLNQATYPEQAPGLKKVMEILGKLFEDRMKEEKRMEKIYNEYINMN